MVNSLEIQGRFCDRRRIRGRPWRQVLVGERLGGVEIIATAGGLANDRFAASLSQIALVLTDVGIL
jgi:hypothetical protein